LPGSIVPSSFSANIENAASAVKPRNAASRSICWSGRSGSPPARGRVVTAAWMPCRGSTLSTGKSEPNATRNPSAWNERHA
jgi:hypothetical protein